MNANIFNVHLVCASLRVNIKERTSGDSYITLDIQEIRHGGAGGFIQLSGPSGRVDNSEPSGCISNTNLTTKTDLVRI
jgi:hypothetical protein